MFISGVVLLVAVGYVSAQTGGTSGTGGGNIAQLLALAAAQGGQGGTGTAGAGTGLAAALGATPGLSAAMGAGTGAASASGAGEGGLSGILPLMYMTGSGTSNLGQMALLQSLLRQGGRQNMWRNMMLINQYGESIFSFNSYCNVF